MLRINQFAKEIGVSNHDVIEALEKRMGIPGKSHSSNLSDDQILQLRRLFDAKSKGAEEAAPLAVHKPTAPVRVVKGAPAPRAEAAPEVLDTAVTATLAGLKSKNLDSRVTHSEHFRPGQPVPTHRVVV